MAQNYVFMTDSDSDLLFSIADEKNIPVVQMPYTLDGVEYLDDNGRTSQEKKLFARMREGSAPNTSLLPTPVYVEYFEPILKEKDLLFVAFSSKMSATIENVYAARDELLAKYPERKMIVVDTLSICGPMSILVLKAHKMYEDGASMEEIEQWLLDNRLKAHAWFTVEDLVYLKRGGRISSTSAILGSALNIKPILVLSKEGKIEPESKVQGRKKAMKTLADKVADNIIDPENQELLLMHGDVEDAAEDMAALIRHKVPTLAGIRIQMIGPVIGAHCGPGTLCIAFMGKERAV